MKKLIFIFAVVMILGLFVQQSKAQYLFSSITNEQDTVLVNGSTDAGSRWFTNTGQYQVIYVEINNGAYWRAYELNYPAKMLGSLRAYIEGSDTTLYVQTDIGGAYVGVPIKYKANTHQSVIDCGGVGDGADVFQITAKALIRFRGIKKGNL